MKIKELFEDSEVQIGSVVFNGKRVSKADGSPRVSWPGSLFTRAKDISSLEGCPEVINGDFWLGKNRLTSLKGCAVQVEGTFSCSENKLVNLIGGPKKIKNDYVANANLLTSLEGVCPDIPMRGYFSNNRLTSLQNIHKQIKYCQKLNFTINPIKSHVLGLLKIESLRNVMLDNSDVEDIINIHLNKDRDILACQQELIDAGFEEFAQL